MSKKLTKSGNSSEEEFIEKKKEIKKDWSEIDGETVKTKEVIKKEKIVKQPKLDSDSEEEDISNKSKKKEVKETAIRKKKTVQKDEMSDTASTGTTRSEYLENDFPQILLVNSKLSIKKLQAELEKYGNVKVVRVVRKFDNDGKYIGSTNGTVVLVDEKTRQKMKSENLYEKETNEDFFVRDFRVNSKLIQKNTEKFNDHKLFIKYVSENKSNNIELILNLVTKLLDKMVEYGLISKKDYEIYELIEDRETEAISEKNIGITVKFNENVDVVKITAIKYVLSDAPILREEGKPLHIEVDWYVRKAFRVKKAISRSERSEREERSSSRSQRSEKEEKSKRSERK